MFYRLDEDRLTNPGALLLEMPQTPAFAQLRVRLKSGTRIETNQPVELKCHGGTRTADLIFTTLGIPVVSARLGELLETVASDDVQLLPAQIEARRDDVKILNVTQQIHCLDREKTVFGNLGIPNLLPVLKPVIDSSKVGTRKLFRNADYPVQLFTTEHVKSAIERSGMTGSVFLQLDWT